jgi:hypothetical protein
MSLGQTEHRTSNVQRRTSNNDVAALRNLISFFCCFRFFILSHSTFDVGRSMFIFYHCLGKNKTHRYFGSPYWMKLLMYILEVFAGDVGIYLRR